jgi:hypothetical protein
MSKTISVDGKRGIMKLRLLLATALVLALTAPVGVQAQEKKTTNCEFSFDADVSPGFWREGNRGTWGTNGETGTMTCDGPMNGKRLTGPGKFAIGGHYGTKGDNTCDRLQGDYQISVNFPTADGKETVKDNGTWAAGTFKGGGAFGGEWAGERAYGTFETTPREGDCVTKPMTKAHVTGRWIEKR